MAEKKLRLRLGVFVALSLALLAALIVVFGGAPTLFANRVRYVVTFPEAPGVGIGTPVRKSGIRIGQVTQLDLDDESGQVKVSVELDRKFQPKETEQATISRGLLSGDTTLDFVPKSNESRGGAALPPGSEIAGVPPLNPGKIAQGVAEALPNAQVDIARVIASVQRFEQAVPKVERAVDEIAGLARGGREFVPELRQTNIKVQELIGTNVQAPNDEPVSVRVLLKQIIDLLQAIRPVADDVRQLVKTNGPELTRTLVAVRQTAESANDLLNPENRRAAAATIKNAQTASDDLVKTIRLVALLVDQSEKTVAGLNARLAQVEPIIAGAGRVIDNAEKATKPLADNSAAIVQNVDAAAKNLASAADNVNKGVGEARGLLGGFTKGEGTVGKAFSDPSLYNNLNETTVGVARLVVRLDRVAKDLEVFSDKVARRPETLGIAGVARPNSGLKDPPSTPLPPGQPLPQLPTPQPIQAPPGQLGPLPLAPGMTPGPLLPIAPVPFSPTYPGTQPQSPIAVPTPVTVQKPASPAVPDDLPPRRQ